MARREELLRAEAEGWQELEEIVASLPPERLVRLGLNAEGWAVRDLMAHIAFWCEDAARALSEIAAGTFDRSAEPEGDERIDAINDRVFERSRTRPVVDVREELHRARAAMLERFGHSPDVDSAYWTAWTCVLAPDAVADCQLVVQLAEKTLAADPKNCDKLQHLGAVLYRAGRFSEGLGRFEPAVQADPDDELSSDDLLMFLTLLVVAGSVTSCASSGVSFLSCSTTTGSRTITSCPSVLRPVGPTTRKSRTPGSASGATVKRSAIFVRFGSFPSLSSSIGVTTSPVTRDPEGSGWSSLPPVPGLDEDDGSSGRFIWLFPNAALAVLPNHVFTLLARPEGPERTVERTAISMHRDVADHASDSALGELARFWDAVNREDIAIIERVQRGLASRAYPGGPMCFRFEEPIHRFQNMLIDRMVGVDRVPPGDERGDGPMFPPGASHGEGEAGGSASARSPLR